MAELADALDSGSSDSNVVEVQVLLPAPNKENRSCSGFLCFWLNHAGFGRLESCTKIQKIIPKYSVLNKKLK